MEKITTRDALVRMGIYPSVKGFYYIEEAVKIFEAAGCYSEKLSMTKDVYPEVATAFKTTKTAVERAIRHALNLAKSKAFNNQCPWGNNCIDIVNKDFIALLAEYTVVEVQ